MSIRSCVDGSILLISNDFCDNREEMCGEQRIGSEMELSFEYRCMSCLRVITPENGVVLSCGDFFCTFCCKEVKDLCPSCGVKGIRSMELKNAPNDVTNMFINPAQQLQSFYDSLKFQINHYKSALERANKLLNLVESERQQLFK